MSKRKKKTKRTSRAQTTPTADVPYAMRLPDKRTVYVEVPAEWCELDVTGELLFKPEAVRFLDRVRVLAMKTPAAPTPGFIRTLREALGLTQTEFGAKIGVDLMTVSRWERGTVKPSAESVKGIEKLKAAAARKGVTIAA